MVVAITSLELKSPLKFFSLSYIALKIVNQIKGTNCVAKKNRGFWTTHYTMTLWNNAEEMKAFAKNGAHLGAMKQGSQLAKEIRILSYEADTLPAWKEAKRRLMAEGRVYTY